MKCKCCGTEFTPERKSAKFCSARCRVKNHRGLTNREYRQMAAKRFSEDTAIINALIGIAHERDERKRLARLMEIGCFTEI